MLLQQPARGGASACPFGQALFWSKPIPSPSVQLSIGISGFFPTMEVTGLEMKRFFLFFSFVAGSFLPGCRSSGKPSDPPVTTMDAVQLEAQISKAMDSAGSYRKKLVEEASGKIREQNAEAAC